MQFASRVLFLLLLGLLAIPETTLAYGGPGSVISGIGALLAAVAALLASLFGFVWFPLKRLYQKMKSNDTDSAAPATADASEDTSTGG